MGELEFQTSVLDHFLGLNLDFLDEEEEPKGEPTKAIAKAPYVEPSTISEPIFSNPSTISEPTLAKPAIGPRSSSFGKIALSL